MHFSVKSFLSYVLLAALMLCSAYPAIARTRHTAVLNGNTLIPGGRPEAPWSTCGTHLLSDPQFLQEVEDNTRALYPEIWQEVQAIRKTAGQQQAFDIGDSTRFYSFDIQERTYFIFSAVLRLIGDETFYWVEKRELERGHVTDDELIEIKEVMENHTLQESRDPDRGIISIEAEYLGIPPNKDGDGKTDIIVMDIRDGWEPGRGFVAGYFTPQDQSDNENSNQRDILYLDTLPGIFSPFSETRRAEGVKETAAHELQHLIHYRYDTGEHSWINEGLSMYAQYLTGFGLEDQIDYLFDTNRDLTNIRIETEGGIDDDVIKDYRKVQLFTHYLWEQYGDEVIRQTVQSPRRGVEGIELALAESGYSVEFEELLTNWALANYINNREVHSAYGYRDEQAAGWRANLHQDHFAFPIEVDDESIEAYAFKYYRFSSAESLRVTFNAPDLAIKAVLYSLDGVKVEDVVTDEEYRVDGLGVDVTNVVFTVINPTLTHKSFAYEATGVQTTQVTELAVDDGEPDIFSEQATFLGFGDNTPGYGWAMRFFPPHPSAKLLSLRMYALSVDGSPVEVHIWDDSGFFGAPGFDIIQPFQIIPPVVGDGFWWDVNLSDYALNVERLSQSIYVGFMHADEGNGVYIGMDNSQPSLNRTWAFFGPGHSNPGWILLDLLGISSITATDTSFIPLDQYNMMFRLKTSVDIAVVPPSPPKTLFAHAGESDVHLQWIANNERDMLLYNLYRGTTTDFAPIAENKISTIVHPNTEFHDDGIENGKVYFYKLTAVDTDSMESLPGPSANASPVVMGEQMVGDHTLALWHFNEGLGNRLFDETRYDYDGLIQSPQWLDHARFGGGLKFDGRFTEIRAPNINIGGVGEDFTITFWYKLYDEFYQQDRTFITQGYRKYTKGKWGIHFSAEEQLLKAFVEAKTDLTQSVETNQGLESWTWHHLAFVRDVEADQIRLYIDAVLVDEAAFPGVLDISNDFDTMIGRDAREIDYVYLSNFRGELDEVHIVDTVLTSFDVITGLTRHEQNPVIPEAYTLHQNFPNPFNPTTTVTFNIPENGHVQLAIYNILGQEVRMLYNQKLLAGSYSVEWDGRNAHGIPLPSGIYIYRLRTEGFDQAKRMVLLK